MKKIYALLVAASVLIAPLSRASQAFAQKEKGDAATEVEDGAERSMPVDSKVAVALCVASGDVVVRGWDRREMRARSTDAADVLLQRVSDAQTSSPATRVEVLILDSTGGRQRRGSNCLSSSDVELDVPRGASVELKTLSGDIRIEDIAEGLLQTINGSIIARRIGKGIEAASVSGDITLENSNGPSRLRSVSGSISAKELNPLMTGDELNIASTSGSIKLEGINQARVEAVTVSGSINMKGALAKNGRYRFRTTSGGIELALPKDASFQVAARVSHGGNILTDFPLKLNTESDQFISRSLNGVNGSGDASITINSFSGTIRLRRK
jgi:hypothetical protein